MVYWLNSLGNWFSRVYEWVCLRFFLGVWWFLFIIFVYMDIDNYCVKFGKWVKFSDWVMNDDVGLFKEEG